jgi:hypothetical protein
MYTMKLTLIIPTYWAREGLVGWKEGDAIYDHPTPLDSEGTLRRALQSFGILEDKEFQVIVIAVATAEDIEQHVEKKVATLIKSTSAQLGMDVLLFGPSHLKQIHKVLSREGKEAYNNLLQLCGYANIRNLCIFIAHILVSPQFDS